MKKIIVSTLIASSLLMAQNYEQTANKAAKELLKTLGGNLKKHLKANGPLDALKFCSQNAYNLTQKVDNNLGKDISIKRISLKPRNPINTPNSAETAILKEMQKSYELTHKPTTKRVENDKEVTIYKPLIIKKNACLICHGDVAKRDPKLYKAIKDLYPTDKAMGYKMGDFRGAIVVTIKK